MLEAFGVRIGGDDWVLGVLKPIKNYEAVLRILICILVMTDFKERSRVTKENFVLLFLIFKDSIIIFRRRL